MWWFASPKIVFGSDSLEFLETLKGKALVVTDSNLLKAGIVSKVLKRLEVAGVEYHIYDKVEPDPSYEIVLEGVEIAKKIKPDTIIGVGGGSSLDAAKGIRVIYENPGLDPEEISPMLEISTGKTKLILIPTTSGSGSEASNAIVLTKTEEGRKISAISPSVIADYAIIDPEMVKDMPPKVVAFTGLDALSHAVDAYVSAWKNDFADGLCIQACKLLFEYLPRAYRNREDSEAVEKVHIAATLSGLAIGCSQAGLSHSIGHSLGAVFHIPHGFACGIALPYTTKYYAKYALEYYEELASHVGIEQKGEKAVDTLVEKITSLLNSLGVPDNFRDLLEEYGISRDDFMSKLDVLVQNASIDNTVVTLLDIPSDEDFRKLFIYAYEGKEVDF
jgi:alcohol dehydrogenase class IV